MAGFLTATALKIGGKALKQGFNLLKNRGANKADPNAPKVPLAQRLKSGYAWAKGQFDKVATIGKTKSGGYSIEPKAGAKKPTPEGEADWMKYAPYAIGGVLLLMLTK